MRFHMTGFISCWNKKLFTKGIRLIRQEESWTSQCSPLSDGVSEAQAKKSSRQKRGLYKDMGNIWNADAVLAYNILRKYKGIPGCFPASGLSDPEIIKAAV